MKAIYEPKKQLSKYVGWGITYYSLRDVLHIIVVPAKTKREAVRKIEKLEYKVKDKKHVRHISIFLYPGPEAKELDWEEMMKPIIQLKE